MSVNNYQELAAHFGHKIEVALYGEANAAIECMDCCEVLIDFDNEELDD